MRAFLETPLQDRLRKRLHARCRHCQCGAALLVALLMLIALLMLGIAAVRIGLQSEQISRNWRDNQIARQAADAALREAEYDIGDPNSPRHALFDAMQSALTQSGSKPVRALLPGVYFPVADQRSGSQTNSRAGAISPLPALWRDLGLAKGGPGVEYGSFTAHFMQAGIGALPARLPRYLIEVLPQRVNRPATDRSIRYRITALGFGPDPNTRIMLQSVYRRSAVSSMRLSWREIAATDAV